MPRAWSWCPSAPTPDAGRRRRGGRGVPAARRPEPGARARSSAERCAAAGHDVSVSSEVAPEFREYERTVTTAMNAYLRPLCAPYLHGARRPGRRGAGDDLGRWAGARSTAAAERPAPLLLSGPAGGVPAAAAVAGPTGSPTRSRFDMGGTSTDVCLVLDGRPAPAAQREVAGLPVRLPSLDVHTIGAGGGSIARLDAGGALVVGPGQRRRRPGPGLLRPGRRRADGHRRRPRRRPHPRRRRVARARRARPWRCRGGARRSGGRIAGGRGRRGARRGRRGDGAGAALGRRWHVASIPVTLALVAFGGAGPLHACALADALGMATVLIPARAGVLSAVGRLGRAAAARRGAVVARPGGSRRGGRGPRCPGRRRARRARRDWPRHRCERSVDCRYAGQSHELTVPEVAAFPAEHERRNGYVRDGSPVEVVALRVSARRSAPLDLASLPTGHASPSTLPARWRSSSRTARSGCPRAGGPKPARRGRCGSSARGRGRDPGLGRRRRWVHPARQLGASGPF